MHLGFLDDGHMTTYYPDSKGITKEEIGAVSKWMEEKNLLPVSLQSCSLNIFL
jgi:dipeptidyl-peptidase-3